MQNFEWNLFHIFFMYFNKKFFFFPKVDLKSIFFQRFAPMAIYMNHAVI